MRDETQRTTYWYGTRFEEPTPRVLREWSDGATHFFDIGSNYGFYSFFLYSSVPRLEIFSFEPNPQSFSRLGEICTRNETTRIHPQAYGLSDEAGRLEFLQLSGNSGHSSFAGVRGSQTGQVHSDDAKLTSCDVWTFDEVVERLKLPSPVHPDWLAKIDVEGFELKVLHGMRKALGQRAFKGLVIELFEENLTEAGASSAEVENFLAEFGYQRQIMQQGRLRQPANHNAYFIPVAD